ncbi:MAG: helix-turn-helix domain-containing protein [Rivularia sp. (in: cyanobacteria)]
MRKIQKQEAIELHKQGWVVCDIASHLGVPERTVYRWIKLYKQPDSVKKSVKKAEPKPTEQPAPYIESSPMEDVYFPSKNWVDFATNLSVEHYATHQNIRVQVSEILNNCLETEPDNTRKINHLALAVNRCIEGERVAVNLDLLDINRAFEVLDKHGFAAIRKEILADG